MARIPIIAGNWKMYKTSKEAKDFIEALNKEVPNLPIRIFLAVPFTAIHAAVEAAQKTPIVIGAQNMHDEIEGSFTGEISVRMIKEEAAHFVLLGHSERRQLFQENNDFINRKVKRALSQDMPAILCIGETQEQRDSGKTQEVLVQQIEGCLKDLSAEDIKKIILAYEPIWAVGSGKTATPEIAEEAHQICRQFIEKKWGKDCADVMSILYGGSVKPDNIASLMHKSNIDGVLVGGASLDAKTFAQIINGSAPVKKG